MTSLATAVAVANILQKTVFFCNNWWLVAAMASNSLYVTKMISQGVVSLTHGKQLRRKALHESLESETWIESNLAVATKFDQRSFDTDAIDNELYNCEIVQFAMLNNKLHNRSLAQSI